MRRAPYAPSGRWAKVSVSSVVEVFTLGVVIGARRPGIIRTSECLASITVPEVAAFEQPYNIRLHQTQGARSRVPRVPALRVSPDSARRW